MNDPAKCSTIVRGDLREDDPVAYAFMDALELTEEQINGLETVINDEEDPAGGRKAMGFREPRGHQAVDRGGEGR